MAPSIPAPVTFLALFTIEFYALKSVWASLVPEQYLPLVPTALALLNIVSYIIWDNFVYPSFISPLRHLPGPSGFIPALQILLGTPRGAICLEWLRNVPNMGLLRLNTPAMGQVLMPTSVQALADLLSHKAYDFEKTYGIRAFLALIIGWGLILAEGKEHKIQRKALLPAFNVKVIRDLYPLMWDKSRLLVLGLLKDMHEHPAVTPVPSQGKPESSGYIEMSEWASRLTLDIIGPTAMGRDFQSLQTEGNVVADNFLTILEPSRSKLSLFGMAFFLPAWFIKRLPFRPMQEVNEAVDSLRSVCRDIVSKKKAAIAAEKAAGTPQTNLDVLTTIMKGGEFEDEAIVDQMLTFLAAGHETTASALTWTCYMLSQHPEAQEKLRQEIRENIPSSDAPVNPSLLESLPYLNGVCHEVFRLFPTVPTTIREAVRDTSLGGQFIPKGTTIVVVPYAINRSPQFWGDNSEQFVPERWIDVDAATGKQHANHNGGAPSNYSQITFLHGPRSCIGQGFAKAELRCALAQVAGKFAMELKDPKAPVTIAGVVTTKPREGMHLKFTSLAGW